MWYSSFSPLEGSMRYTHDEIVDLMDSVEEQGGTHLDRQCKARKYIFTGDRIKPAILPGCGNDLLFAVPYEGRAGAAGSVVACAVDDDMGKWPRFGGDRFARGG